MEITPQAASGIVQTMPDADGFRGLEISLRRRGDSKHSAVEGLAIARRPERNWQDGEFVLDVLSKLFRRLPPVVWLTRERLEYVDPETWAFEPDTL